MGEEEQRRRREFLGLTGDDAERVRELREVFARHARQFAERFYEHLLADPHTAGFLKDPGLLERLKGLQAHYFAGLLEGAYGADYFEGRLRVGLVHQRVGLEPAWYLGAYNQYVQLTFPLFVEAFGGDLPRVLPRLLSLVKVIFLDIGLALDTYFREATGQLRQRNDELQQALQLYWQAQQREEQLRKLVSHEVRGGLAATITSLEDLQDRLGPEAAGELQAVARRCWGLSNLLGEMLAPSAQAGGPAWVPTAPIFETLVARFGLYAEGRAIHLYLPEHPPRVWADPLQLREVFANLVSNAVRYLDEEPGRVEDTCRREGDFYAFAVADNGPGIPEAIRDRLFEPFVRGPAAPGRPREGSGLGLYFVRTVVEQGGGRVWVESTPGAGTTFHFTVPAAPPAGQAAAGDGAAGQERGAAGDGRPAAESPAGSPNGAETPAPRSASE
jgi:signal transduction histidine kinase